MWTASLRTSPGVYLHSKAHQQNQISHDKTTPRKADMAMAMENFLIYRWYSHEALFSQSYISSQIIANFPASHVWLPKVIYKQW